MMYMASWYGPRSRMVTLDNKTVFFLKLLLLFKLSSTSVQSRLCMAMCVCQDAHLHCSVFKWAQKWRKEKSQSKNYIPHIWWNVQWNIHYDVMDAYRFEPTKMDACIKRHGEKMVIVVVVVVVDNAYIVPIDGCMYKSLSTRKMAIQRNRSNGQKNKETRDEKTLANTSQRTKHTTKKYGNINTTRVSLAKRQLIQRKANKREKGAENEAFNWMEKVEV